jgi:hypothetical protein
VTPLVIIGRAGHKCFRHTKSRRRLRIVGSGIPLSQDRSVRPSGRPDAQAQ